MAMSVELKQNLKAIESLNEKVNKMWTADLTGSFEYMSFRELNKMAGR